jgi:flagellar motor switch protein FliN/FliY
VDDILQLEDGSIIKLNNNVNQPVNMLVDKIPIAKGEVVVIDESFGIRLKEMLSSKE